MRPIFCKFNNNYNKKFQTKTSIWKDKETYCVTKEPISDEAKEHLLNMKKSKEKLSAFFENLSMCDIQEREGIFYFPFIKGISLSKKLMEIVKTQNANLLLEEIKFLLHRIKMSSDNICDFYMQDEFREIFGESSIGNNIKSYKECVFDITPNNIILGEDKDILIDYEWYFKFPVPIELLQFHCITSIYLIIPAAEEILKIDELCKLLNFEISVSALQEHEKNFLNYINSQDGKKYYLIKGRYLKEKQNLYEIYHKKIKQLEEDSVRKDTYINNLEVAIKKQDNYINNLQVEKKDIYIKNLESNIEKQAKYIDHIENNSARKDDYISNLETATKTQSDYIGDLETAIKKQSDYIDNLEVATKKQNIYITNLEGNINLQKSYIEALTKELSEKSDYLSEMENAINEIKHYNETLKDIDNKKNNYISALEEAKQYYESELCSVQFQSKVLEDSLNNKISELRKRNFELENSFIWKLDKAFRRRGKND